MKSKGEALLGLAFPLNAREGNGYQTSELASQKWMEDEMDKECSVKEGKMKSFMTWGILNLMVLFLLAGSARVLLGQNVNTGEIRGLVTDTSGAAIPGVQVTITNVLTGVSTVLTTNSSGTYDAPTLLMGSYSITFTKHGFATFIRRGITLGMSQVVGMDATLKVGEVSERVTVTAATPLVQTQTAESSATLGTIAVIKLPSVGANWYNYLQLLPGTASTSASQQTFNFEGPISVNGTAPYTQSWLNNGANAMLADANDNPAVAAPLDTIAQIVTKTNNFSAQYGNGSSVVNLISKTGTNRWHGSLYEFVQNTSFNARNFFSPTVSPYHWNEFGGAVGGPIKHDKAFFFFGYQDSRQVTYSPTIITVPTAAEEAGNFSNPAFPTVYNPASLSNGVRTPLTSNTIPPSEISPWAAKVQQYWPKPNLPGLYNNYFDNVPLPEFIPWYGGNVQYNFSAKNQLTLNVWDSNSSLPEFNAIPISSYASPWHEQNNTLSDSWTISPTMVNQASFEYMRNYEYCTAPNLNVNYPAKLGELNPMSNLFPSVSIRGAISTRIRPGTYNCIEAEMDWSPSDVLTIIKGKHTLKMGGEFDRNPQNTSSWGDTQTGNFSFSGTMTANPADPSSSGLGYADFLYGLPQTWSVAETPVMGWRGKNGQVFFQDDYQIRRDLTLNLGFRYEVYGGYGEVQNRLSNFDPSIINPATKTPGALWYQGQNGRNTIEATNPRGFQPRVGFAWSPRSNWAIRGAYGIFDQVWSPANYSGGWGQGWEVQGFQTSPDLYTPIFSMSPPTATLLAAYPTLTQGPGLPLYPTAGTRTASLLNGQSISYYPYNAPIPYIQQAHLDIQHQLPGSVFVDVGYVWTRGIHLPWFADANQVRANALGPGNAVLREPYPQYLGIEANLEDGVSNYNALQLTVKKKYSNGLLFGANYTWSKAMDTQTASNWIGGDSGLVQNTYNLMANYGPGNMDMPNIFNFYGVYQLPVGTGKRFLNHGEILLNGVLGGWQLSTMLQLHSGSPFTPTMGTSNLSGSLGNDWYPNRIASGTVQNPSISEWFNPSAFVEPAPFTFGNSGRDILRGPSYKDWDLSLNKGFPIRKLGENGKFDIRWDVFDTLNSPNFGLPNSGIGTLGAGAISSAVTNRTMQLGAQLTF